ncbi:hypothetical protein Ae406Ps2_1205 [Pseudonocardia sp. Ae406_Ps2]|nr:hypothetical protein Ae406Ps2_1205 [Pseudonocardia sp. Ae406_Ps2]OLM07001.1 hypothetical protein Ae331Ps2_4711c [Pseudonocardia sp. Ae331_Ps2]OLM14194.1 hypothetical protein Ae505Ps2_4324c [Pseudonocardia sp. Ae505_Ps2]OLM22780.1 hypothetical protein Ae706Ps2_1212 [Pseudonocardia sp. Ae706_Ps2]
MHFGTVGGDIDDMPADGRSRIRGGCRSPRPRA